MEEEKTVTHESYGMIGINRQTGGNRSLFGSSIKHNTQICIRIKHAEVKRHLHQEWYYANGAPIVEILLSPDQFSQMITNPNVGSGVPCTITFAENREMDPPPYEGMNEIFNNEIKKEFDTALEMAWELTESAQLMLGEKGPIKVSDKKTLSGKIFALRQHIQDNMPFLHKQYCRAMNKTVTAAKAEIEEFYTNMVMKMGRKALEEGVPKKPEIEE